MKFANLDTPVTITEDHDGDYRGWQDTGREDDPPVLIQHARTFEMQFVYGVQAEIDCGKGTVIHLEVSPA